jgi:GntR family transcriptional regulator, transcriptional repressor for pyruvate dehydrogenase complex
MIGLVLESREVRLDDLAAALRQMEPVCAALCAGRPDRATAVVPTLRAINERTLEVLPDQLGFTSAGREFHEAVVALCGNETIKVVAGALEALWSAHEQDWARRATSDSSFPEAATRLEGARAHKRLLDLIEQGDVAGVSRAARKHLESSQIYSGSDGNEVIRATAVRGSRR